MALEKKQNDPYLLFSLRRFAAYAVDWYLYSVILISFNVLMMKAKGLEPVYYMTLEQYSGGDALGIMAALLLLHGLLFVVLVKVWKGQTIGKKIFHIRIVSCDGNPVSLWQLFLREFAGVFALEGWFSPLNSYFRTLLAMYFGDIIMLNRIWIAAAVLSLFIMRCNKDRRMFHDYIGRTKVIPGRLI